MQKTPTPRPTPSWQIDLAALTLLVALSTLWTIHLWSRVPGVETGEAHRIYTTESAVQYRYMNLIAEGNGIPTTDTSLEWPDGIQPARDLAIGMETFEGSLLRLFGWQDEAAVRVAWLAMFIYALRLIPLYISARLLWRSPWAAIATTTLYAAFFPGYGRVIGTYGREHFALPFLLTGLLWGVLAALGEEEESSADRAWWLSLFSAWGWVFALGTWHLTRSIFLLYVLGMAALSIFVLRRRRAVRTQTHSLAIIGACSIFMFPMLRTRGFILSPPMLALAAMTAMAWILPRLKEALVTRVGALAIVIGATVLGRILAPDDSHVIALLLAKVRMLGQLPADPTRIPFEARALWIEAFQSPTAYVWLYVYGPLAALGVAGLITALRRHPASDRPALIVVLAGCVVFGGGFVLVTRMGVFLSPFLALAAGGLAVRPPERRTAAPWVAIALVLCLDVYRSATYRTPHDRIGAAVAEVLPRLPAGGVPDLGYERQRLLDWIGRNTAQDEALVARFALSPTLLLATERPIVLHSKFETPGIRTAVREFLTSVYGSEYDFWRWCRSRQATWVVVEPEWTLESGPRSMLYMAGRQALPTDSAAYRLFFFPDSVTRFELSYQNSHYRVYRVLAEDETPRHLARPVPQAMFDATTFGATEATAPTAARLAGGLQHLLQARALWQHGLNLCQQGKIQEGGDALASALRQYRGLPIARSLLATLLLQRGDTEAALFSARQATLYEPDVVSAWLVLAEIEQAAGNPAEARKALETARALDPDDTRIQQALGALRP